MSLQHWENYYSTGAMATGPTGPDGGYDLEVRETWAQFFATQPDGARLLDLGTGNGAVALIAAETASALGRQWEIHGVDLARIDPLRHVPEGARRLGGVTFHPQVAAEKLPFEDQSFDAVSGHYALEYFDLAAALAEVHRVLKPGGDVQFVVSSKTSVLVSSAVRSIRESDLIFKQTKIFRRLHRLLTLENASEETLRRITAELRAGIAVLKQGLEDAKKEGGGLVLSMALDAVQNLLVAHKQGMKPQALGVQVERSEAHLRTQLRQLNEGVALARGEHDMQLIEKTASEIGFSLIERSPQFHAGRNVVGWQLLMHRA